MKTWLSKLWVRNVIGAVVALASIAVLIVTSYADSWTTYRHTVVPDAVVAKGETGQAGGYTWRLDGIKHLNKSSRSFGLPMPANTVLTVVTVERTGPPPEKVICNGFLTDGEHRWKSEGVAGFSAPEADGVTSLCSQPGLLQYTFLVPADVVPTAMDIAQFDGRITVRLLL